MKITKQRLKEIIKEELSEMDLPKWEGEPFGEYDLDAENEKAGLGDLQTEPRHEGGTPMERLLNKLLIVSNIGVGEGGAAAARKLGLGGDEEVIAYLDDLLGNQMYKESGLEENRTIDQATAQKLAAQAGVRWSGNLVVLMKKYPNTPAGRSAFLAALKR